MSPALLYSGHDHGVGMQVAHSAGGVPEAKHNLCLILKLMI